MTEQTPTVDGAGIDVGGAAAWQAVRLEQATIAYNILEGVIAVDDMPVASGMRRAHTAGR